MNEETQDSEEPIHVINCEQYEIVELYEKSVKVIVPSIKEIGYWNNLGWRSQCAAPEGTYMFPIETIELIIEPFGEDNNPNKTILITAFDDNNEEKIYLTTQKIYLTTRREKSSEEWGPLIEHVKLMKKKRKRKNALDMEEHLDYDAAIQIWKELGENKEAARVRKLKTDLAAPKTEIHGDYVDDRDTTYIDDRDTIIKDSVISKSNVGAGGDDKFTKLKELTEMKEKGLIDDADYEKMKREIIG